MSREAEFLALPVVRVNCVVEAQDWLKVGIRQYPCLSLARGDEDFLSAPAKGDLVCLDRLLVG